MPGEFRWDHTTREYFTIFDRQGIVQIDAKRVDLGEMKRIEWPEEWKYELSSGVIAYDPEDEIKKLVNQKTKYTDELRLNRILNAILRIDSLCINTSWATIIKRIEKQDFLVAHEQLNVALEEILKILYAYNRTFMPWRSKWLVRSLSLPWMPSDFMSSVSEFLLIRTLSKKDAMRRLTVIRGIFGKVMEKLTKEGILPGEDPIGYAFSQTHKEIGYAGNMKTWLKAHQEHAAVKRAAQAE